MNKLYARTKKIMDLGKIAQLLLNKVIEWLSILIQKESDAIPGAHLLTPPYDNNRYWCPIGKYEYAGVIWRIYAPAPDPGEPFNPSKIPPSSIEVEEKPRCPECETEIEKSSFWRLLYIWKCVNCNFKKINRDNFAKERERVEKIVRRKWEEQLEKQKHDDFGV